MWVRTASVRLKWAKPKEGEARQRRKGGGSRGNGALPEKDTWVCILLPLLDNKLPGQYCPTEI